MATTSPLVAVAADSAYAIPLHACVSSIVEHCRGVDLYVLDCGLSAEDRRTLRETVGAAGTVSFVGVPIRELADLPEATCGSVATYARLFIDATECSGRILYLDADTIVLSSVLPLYQVELSGAVSGAVREMYTPVVSADNGVAAWRDLSFNADDPYFNAGVMLVDLDEWRRRSVRARCLDYLRTTGPLVRLFDQEALNVVLHGAWIELPQIWNVTRYWYRNSRRVGDHANILEEARIIHFISEEKPWLGSDVVPGVLSNKFFAALDRSSLAGWRPGSDWLKSHDVYSHD
ncbi:MAG TPA: glycosyltransferase family 8 protein [Acidimicrobiales bacterium]|nr:glycosyltransferase family 8 protein [Acidimicrobiales bacterium]